MNFQLLAQNKLAFLTVAVYMAAVVLLAWLSGKKNSRVLLWLLILGVSAVAGLRAYHVAIDTKVYVTAIFERLYAGSEGYIHAEIGFRWFCEFFLMLSGGNATVVLTAIALFINGLILARLFELRGDCDFALCVLSYMCVAYWSALNVMAQFMSVALVFYATKYLYRGQVLVYLALTAVAMCFHSTALVGCGILMAYVLISRKTGNKRRNRELNALLLLSPIVLAAALVFLLKSSRFKNYFSTYLVPGDSAFGFMAPVKIVLFFVLCVLRARSATGAAGREGVAYPMAKWNAFIGYPLQVLGYVFTYVGRLCFQFLLFEPMFVFCRPKDSIRPGGAERWIRLAYIVLALYSFISELSMAQNHFLPYQFFWQT